MCSYNGTVNTVTSLLQPLYSGPDKSSVICLFRKNPFTQPPF